ncbi:MAG: 50S ribosomal protein L32 [Oscillospiraceae bacterium]|jgi:large subunit ribosomal protein L32|nr:50S ribosomal protein L32 [Oscillospiraceae bacterium]
MALPKGKISKARKHSRQANWKISAPSIVKCPRCQKMKLSHRVCKHCGYYDGRNVLNISEDKKKNA